jgi:hypothetical protein
MSLFSAISNGDTSGAQSAYDSLTSLLLSNDSSTSSSTSATSSSSTDNTTSTSNSSTTTFTKLLSEIGTSLSSGDINGAQSSLDSFLSSLSSGSLVNTTA